jgi:hypothetical protein
MRRSLYYRDAFVPEGDARELVAEAVGVATDLP